MNNIPIADPPGSSGKPSDADTAVEGGAKGGQPAEEGADGPKTSEAAASAEAAQSQEPDVATESAEKPVAQDVQAHYVPPAGRYNPSAPAASTFEQHFAATMARKNTILKDSVLDGADGAASGPSSGVARQQLTPLESELTNAVNDQYGEFGITVDDLKTYLDVSLDIDDAISAGRKANIEHDRYTVYKRVEKLIKFGPDKTPEELQRLDRMAEEEMLSLPWPSTMTRQYLKEKHGMKLPRMKKDDQTRYDQVP